MILILIALISITALAITGAIKLHWSIFSEVVCPIVVFSGFCGLIFYAVLAYNYIAADYKKDIINREYKTNYTQAEVFYASGVINTIRELDRKRIEINGNIAKDK